MRVLRASLVHQIRPSLGMQFADVLFVAEPTKDGTNDAKGRVDSMSVVGNLLIVNGRKAVPLSNVLEMDIEAEVKPRKP